MKKNLLLVFLLFISISITAQLNVGLKAYYPFNGNDHDESGNGNNPIANDATLTMDRLGNINSAYHFNGSLSSGNSIEIPDDASLHLGNQMSLCAWVKADGFYTGKCHGNNILVKAISDDAPGEFYLRFDDHAFLNGENCNTIDIDTTKQAFYGYGAGVTAAGPFIQTGAWNSIVFTYDGTEAKFYLNCVLVNTTIIPNLNFTNTDNLFFGRLNAYSYPYWFNGDMDEIRIYDRPLSQEEVSEYGECISISNAPTVMNQNAPNPFNDNTVITYMISKPFKQAQIIFSSITGHIIKRAEILEIGKGQVSISSKDIGSGIHTYTLIVDGKVLDTKKMMKQ